MIPGLTLGLVDSPALFRALSITNKRGVAELNLLSEGNFPVINEAALDKVLLALLFLLRFKVSRVGGVTLLAVAMFALNDVVVLGLLNHDNLVNTPLTSCSNGSNVQVHILATASLTSFTGRDRFGLMGMVVFM